MGCFLSGCGFEGTLSELQEEITWLNSSTIEPQSNIQDFMTGDYNVKDVDDAKISKLDKFDVSGPTYNGLSADDEIIESTEDLDFSTELTVCISAYHKNTKNSTASKVNYWYVCASPNDFDTVRELLAATDFYKDGGYNADTDINVILEDAYKFVSGTSSASVTQRAALATVLSKAYSSGYLKKAYAYSNSQVYTLEKNSAAILKNALANADVNAVATDTGEVNGLTGIEMCETASNAGASYHIIFDQTGVSVKDPLHETDGWKIFYKGSNDETGEESKALAEAIFKKLTTGDTKVPSSPAYAYKSNSKENTHMIFNTIGGAYTSNYFRGGGDVLQYTKDGNVLMELNYALVPTVVIQYDDKASKLDNLEMKALQTKFADAICAAIKEIK